MSHCIQQQPKNYSLPFIFNPFLISFLFGAPLQREGLIDDVVMVVVDVVVVVVAVDVVVAVVVDVVVVVKVEVAAKKKF